MPGFNILLTTMFSLPNFFKDFDGTFLPWRNSSDSNEEDDLCILHSERLELFCLDHQEPVCVMCQDLTIHKDHSFSPIKEATQDLREDLNKSLQPLKEKLQKAYEVKQDLKDKTAHIKDQSRHTERQIQDQFKKLHQFLLEEEEARMKALREEEELKTQRMKDKMASVSRAIEALSKTIRVTEEQLRAADICFLLKYKTAVERVQRCPLLEETKLGPGALIDQAKHLGNMVFNIWTNMKRLVQYTPVILNPNTAPDAVLSDDLTSFTPKKKHKHPNEPDITEKHKHPNEPNSTDVDLVFGSEGFDSGYHRWDVEVGDNTNWGLGVVTCPTEERVKNLKDLEAWGIGFSDGGYAAVVFNEKNKIKLKTHPRKIRVHLDCDAHKLSFQDADSNTHIHSFTNINHNNLFPFFLTVHNCPIRILPQEI